MTDSQITLVTAPELKDALRCCFDAKRPVFVWGSPGIGKSQIFGQVAQEDERPLLDVRASQWDAVDTRGVPFVDQSDGMNVTRWAVPGLFPNDGNPVLALDELNTAAQSVQAALYQLILDRRLGEYVLPTDADIVAAGNLDTDRAVTTRMSTALADRFVHFELKVDSDAWLDWATRSGRIAVEVIAYLSWRPQNLHVFDPKSASKAQPTPRGWEYVSDLVIAARNRGTSKQVLAALITGKIGEAVGMEFFAFLDTMAQLTHWTTVLNDPDGARLYDDPSTNYALMTLLANNASESNFGNIITYLERVANAPSGGPEFMVMCVKAATRRDPDLMQTGAYVKWATTNSHWMV